MRHAAVCLPKFLKINLVFLIIVPYIVWYILYYSMVYAKSMQNVYF